MELTKEKLEKRLQVLEQQKAQSIANVNACEGAILTVHQLLQELEAVDKPQESEVSEE